MSETPGVRSITEHVPLPGGSFGAWRLAVLRGAGFPLAALDRLACPTASAAVDRFIEEEERVRSHVLERLRAAVPATRRKRQLLRGLHRLEAGEDVDRVDNGAVVAALSPVEKGDLDGLRAGIVAAYEHDVLASRSGLASLVADPRFREAVTWQTGRRLHDALDTLVDVADHVDGQRRRRERVAASYLQRYYAKNDTIGFFGPVGWCSVEDRGPAISMRPAEPFLRSRSSYFEGWCIDGLARVLSQRADLRRWAPARLLPYLRLEGDMLLVPEREPMTLPREQAFLLRSCDGRTPAATIAARASAELGIDPEVVFEGLALAATMGAVKWGFDTPYELWPERSLREQLMRIGPEDLRTSALATLDAVEAARDSVARAAGDPAALSTALDELARTYTEVTGADATRAHGKVYGARGLVYEDAVRNVDVRVGPGLLERLGPPLSVLLESVRWYSHRVAAGYQRVFDAHFDALSACHGPVVDATLFYKAIMEDPTIGSAGSRSEPVVAALQDLQSRWRSVLEIDDAGARVSLSLEELRARAGHSFAAPGPGWTLARHISPDILIAAPSVEAIEAGDYEIVLGEVHLGNTMMVSALASQHPDANALSAVTAADLGPNVILPVKPKSEGGQRTNIVASARTLRLEFMGERSPGPPELALKISDFVVERVSDALLVRTRDGAHRWELVDFMGYVIQDAAKHQFDFLPVLPHVPRVTVDGVVLIRERWHVPASELEFSRIESSVDRFVKARRWARERGMPRCVFVRLPTERKPVFVDFDAPLFVDAMAALVRAAYDRGAEFANLTVTEMLPAPSQTWLEDASGARYTSELRLVVVDDS